MALGQDYGKVVRPAPRSGVIPKTTARPPVLARAAWAITTQVRPFDFAPEGMKCGHNSASHAPSSPDGGVSSATPPQATDSAASSDFSSATNARDVADRISLFSAVSCWLWRCGGSTGRRYREKASERASRRYPFGVLPLAKRNQAKRLPNGRLPAPPHDVSGHTWHHPDQVLIPQFS